MELRDGGLGWRRTFSSGIVIMRPCLKAIGIVLLAAAPHRIRRTAHGCHIVIKNAGLAMATLRAFLPSEATFEE